MADNPQRSTLLIVEDDPDIRESVAEILSSEGYSVAVASNGLEGLNLLMGIARPCLILLDMMMPVMDGPEFMARLMADPAFHDCKVLIMTASHVQLPPGAVGLIRKPFELADLFAFVDRY